MLPDQMPDSETGLLIGLLDRNIFSISGRVTGFIIARTLHVILIRNYCIWLEKMVQGTAFLVETKIEL